MLLALLLIGCQPQTQPTKRLEPPTTTKAPTSVDVIKLPFGADKLKAFNPAGTVWQFANTSDVDPPSSTYITFQQSTPEGATLLTTSSPLEQKTSKRTSTSFVTWDKLYRRSTLPNAQTVQSEEVLEHQTLGTVTTIKLTHTNSANGTQEIWVSPEHPGFPLRLIETENGKETFRIDVVAISEPS